MATRFHPARVGAAVLGASLALMAVAPMAFATTTAKPVSHPDPAQYRGVNVQLTNDQQTSSEETWLIPLKVDGVATPVLTYCVELTVDVDYGDVMNEVDWSKYPVAGAAFNANKANINWILHNSYPAVPLKDVAAKAGKPNLTKQEAIGGTQAAIWHYSDTVGLGKAADDVTGLYNYLTGIANTGLDQPKPTLEVTAPSDTTPNSTGLIGPFTVATTDAGPLTLAGQKLPSGVSLTDANGKPLGTITDKTQIFFKLAAGTAAGTAGFSLNGEATLDTGRLFVGGLKPDGTPAAQSLIVASAENAKLTKSVEVSWKIVTPPTSTTTAPPTSTTGAPTTSPTSPTSSTVPPVAPASNQTPLAYTGASVIGAAIAGIVLIGAGVGALFLVRRRKTS